MEFVVDEQVFNRHVKQIYDIWDEKDINSTSNDTNGNSLQNIDAFVIVCGKYDVISYNKTSTIQEWLFNVDISESIIVLCEKEIVCFASKKKIDYLRPIASKSIHPVMLYVKEKANEDEFFTKIIDHIKSSRNGKTIGCFPKDRFEGSFYDNWQKYKNDNNLSIVDVSDMVSRLLRVKGNEELDNIQTASDISCNVFNKFFKSKLLNLIETNKKIKHNDLATQLEECTDKKLYYPNQDINPDDVEMAFPVIIQSGGDYSIKFSIESDSKNLKFDLIVLMIGIRYKYYCSCLVRTLMINPSNEQQKNYKLLQEAFDVVINELKPNKPFNKVYKAFYTFFEQKNKQLLKYLPSNIGFSTGIEFRDISLLIDNSNQTIIQSNMVFNILVTLNNIENGKNKYSMSIGDTVKIGETEAILCTKLTKRQLGNVSIRVDESSEESDDSTKNNTSTNVSDSESSTEAVSFVRESRDIRSRHRNLPKREISEGLEIKRKNHQNELAKQLHKNAMKRYLNVDVNTKSKSSINDQQSVNSKFSCYSSVHKMSKEKDIIEMRILVDKIHDCIVLPIMGIAVPFHISTIKNINTSLESDYMYLRINFMLPIPAKNWTQQNGSTTGDAYGSVKEIIYRSLNIKEIGKAVPDSAHLINVFRQVKELQKKFKTKQAEEKELQGLIKQDDLQLSTNKNMPRLRNLLTRPAIGNRRAIGTLEVHTNGFRYSASKGDHIDILFSNIQNAFYQPCENEMVTIVHFRLKNPVLLGKKKFVDIQFYTEIGAAVADLEKSGYTTTQNDPDEIEAEERELEIKQKINTTFKHFCEAVETLTNGHVEFDSPFRDLGFDGVPSRVSIFLTPTTHCLINLMEMPFFVLVLDDIELVHFERVQANTKHFDMVFVFKDYSKKIVMISCVPMTSLDSVKDWLDSCDIKYSEGIQSLNWIKIMKTIQDDPKEFFETGGWTFLDPASEQDENLIEQNSESEEDDYNPLSSDEDITESDDSYEGDAESSEESAVDSDEPSDALSWDELEEVARREDENKHRHHYTNIPSKRGSHNEQSTFNRKKSRY